MVMEILEQYIVDERVDWRRSWWVVSRRRSAVVDERVELARPRAGLVSGVTESELRDGVGGGGT